MPNINATTPLGNFIVFHGLTATEVAVRAGLSLSMVSKILNGDRQPSRGSLHAIAQALTDMTGERVSVDAIQ